MFLAHVGPVIWTTGLTLTTAAPTQPTAPSSPAPASALLHLDETRAKAILGSGESSDEKIEGWFLDTRATHHMTDREEYFSDLDRGVQGSVKFRDSSAVKICSIGTAVFLAKTGEHKVLHGGYYIPALRNNIISLGQLDRSGARVVIDDGLLRIWDRQRRLVAKMARGRNQLYVLQMEVTRPLASPLTVTMKRGVGMSGLGISTSMRSRIWHRGRWCGACLSWIMLTSCATLVSSPSIIGGLFLFKPSTAHRSSPSSSTATCVAPSRRQRQEVGATSSCWSMMPLASCAWCCWRRNLEQRTPSSESRPQLRPRVAENCASSALTMAGSSRLQSLQHIEPMKESRGTS